MNSPKPISLRVDENLWRRIKDFQKKTADQTLLNVSLNGALLEILDRGLKKSGL
jgi:hypothetical protein